MLNPLEIELRHRIRQDCYSTAYPWKPEDWAQYNISGALKFSKGGKISFYIHIPFCPHLCKFCEYTRCLVPNEAIQRNYLQILHRDIRNFLFEYPNIILEGFDIGGGTPTVLSPSNFAYLMQIYREVINSVSLTDDFEPSIETSFQTITPEKIRMIRDTGIRRISIGIQSLYFSRRTSDIGWRYPEAKKIIEAINMIRQSRGFKINLDFMYGFKFQSYDEFENLDRIALEELNPDQVTIYELRTNQLKSSDIEQSKLECRSSNYDTWYRILTDLGYLGRYGQNTFSINSHDFGVSSYIRHRMLDGGDYKGFGISAQSVSNGNVEYNIGKNASDIMALIPADRIPKDASFEAIEHYELPNEEKFAKFVCVSAYSGGFNWRIAQKRYMPDFFQRFGKLLDFLTQREEPFGHSEIEITDERINATRHGFDHYGPLFSLFYKPELITLK